MARSMHPSQRIIDFVGDLRLVDEHGASMALAGAWRVFVSMVRLMGLLTHMGVRYHTHEGKRSRPTQAISWIGFTVSAGDGVVELDPMKR